MCNTDIINLLPAITVLLRNFYFIPQLCEGALGFSLNYY